jgi:hypothetical protein
MSNKLFTPLSFEFRLSDCHIYITCDKEGFHRDIAKMMRNRFSDKYAEEIVKRVNMHDELVRELENAICVAENAYTAIECEGWRDQADMVMKNTKQILEKSKGLDND